VIGIQEAMMASALSAAVTALALKAYGRRGGTDPEVLAKLVRVVDLIEILEGASSEHLEVEGTPHEAAESLGDELNGRCSSVPEFLERYEVVFLDDDKVLRSGHGLVLRDALVTLWTREDVVSFDLYVDLFGTVVLPVHGAYSPRVCYGVAHSVGPVVVGIQAHPVTFSRKVLWSVLHALGRSEVPKMPGFGPSTSSHEKPDPLEEIDASLIEEVVHKVSRIVETADVDLREGVEEAGPEEED